MTSRLIGILTSGKHEPEVKHYVGLPPSLAEGNDAREKMPDAAFLVIEQNPDGVFLYRYAVDGSYAGDTWHANLDDAKHQALYEYGEPPINWDTVGDEVEDPIAYGLKRIQHST